jgi:N-acetylmuramoyl-L-alanine amidase
MAELSKKDRKGKIIRMLFSLLFFFHAASAAIGATGAPNWIILDKQPHLTLEEWARFTQYQSLYEGKSGRILLERKKHPTIILLLDSPYAFQGEKFIPLPQAPFSRGGKILFTADTGERVFSGVIKQPEELQKFTQELSRIRGNLSAGPCQLEHPIKKIFLDPGHGGDDYGTKHGGVKEKDVVLKFSSLVADELRRLGFEVSVSRTKDVFLPLEIRSKLALKWKADLFISLHVNSSPREDAHGTETYILSQDATDAEARKLALIENSIVKDASDKQSAVQDILWDMEQTTYLQDSAYLASNIQESLVAHAHDLLQKEKISGDWKNRGVRQAPFYVLNKATMPAILVELGYLSNKRDRKLMTEKIFQESLAKALAMGVKKYKEACRTN